MNQVIVFLSGAILMSLEMVGSRILAPTFGTSIYVWGSLIVVVMTALTLGYYLGGKIADKYPSLLMMAIILGVAGIFIGFLPFWTQPVNFNFSMLGPRTGSLLASFAFFLAPGLLLASMSPYGIKLAGRNLTTIGNTSGYIAAISSAGSIVGTLLTSFYLIPAMGVRNIVHSLGVILLLLSITMMFTERRRTPKNEIAGQYSWRIINLLIIFLILNLFFLLILWKAVSYRTYSHDNTSILFEHDSLYHHIIVDQNSQERHLHFDNSYQSAMDLDEPLNMVFTYTSYLHLGLVVHPHPTRALFIGLGGGSAPKKFLHDYASLQTVDIVEIDPEIADIARRYFDLPDNPRLNVIVQDGRLYLEKKAREITGGLAKPYDIVIIDAYSSSSIPYHLTTREFLQGVRKVLSLDGVVVSNIIGSISGPYSLLLRSMTLTFTMAFPQTYLFPVGGYLGPDDPVERNVILVATMDPKPWNAGMWQKQAAALYNSGVITENVPQYARMLLPERFIKEKAWLSGVPLLTDDYAPVDTLQNPL